MREGRKRWCKSGRSWRKGCGGEERRCASFGVRHAIVELVWRRGGAFIKASRTGSTARGAQGGACIAWGREAQRSATSRSRSAGVVPRHVSVPQWKGEWPSTGRRNGVRMRRARLMAAHVGLNKTLMRRDHRAPVLDICRTAPPLRRLYAASTLPLRHPSVEKRWSPWLGQVSLGLWVNFEDTFRHGRFHRLSVSSHVSFFGPFVRT